MVHETVETREEGYLSILICLRSEDNCWMSSQLLTGLAVAVNTHHNHVQLVSKHRGR